MELAEFATKPTWEDYEASLLAKGYEPYFDPEIAARVPSFTCCSCSMTPAYVGMTNGRTALGFLACQPDCGQWLWFLAPAPSTRP